MGFFYFDESVHVRANFVLGAFVYSETSLDEPVADALRQSGLTPYVDEFKSGSFMAIHPEQIQARDVLGHVVRRDCRIGLVVSPASDLPSLGNNALHGLRKILTTNSFRSLDHDVYFDQGIAATDSFVFDRCNLHFEQNSVAVLGLQVADLVAHHAATMLLASLGFSRKTLKAGENSGYDPNTDVPLDFGLWARLRWNFFAAAPPPYETWQSQLEFKVDVESRGLYIADACDDNIKTAALARFGEMYLGCTH